MSVNSRGSRVSRPAGAAAGGDGLLIGLIVAIAVVVGWVWATGELAAWLASGRWLHVGLSAAAGVAARLPAHLADPRLAWPSWARRALPGTAALDACAGFLFAVIGSGGVFLWSRWRAFLPPVTTRAAPGARWATRGDLESIRHRQSRHGRSLRVRSRRSPSLCEGGRLVIGYAATGLGRRLVAAEARHSVLVVGPTQSGKTTALAIPAILEWRGPVVATSVKDDLAAATLACRSQLGPCAVFDPTAATGLDWRAGWSPLGICEGWSAAQRVATWMVEATPARAGLTDAAFWYAAAAKQLAPLLLAARRGVLGMEDVVRWTNQGCFEEPRTLLELAGENEAVLAIDACDARDDRIRSSVTTTLETVLGPFEDPVVAASTRGCDVDLDALLDDGGSLYLCGPSHEQHRVQSLFATLVSAVVDAAFRRAHARGAPLDPPLLVVLDEAANIAPVRDLDTLASTGAGAGIQLVTVCQDLAQLGARYGPERARTIANNHRAKLVLSGVCDLSTLDLVSGLAGEQAVPQETVTHDLSDGRRTRSSAIAFRRLAPTEELRCIPPGEAVLVYGHLPPVRLRLRPWYEDRILTRRASGSEPA